MADMTLKAILMGEDRSMSRSFKGAGDQADRASGRLKAFAVVGAAAAGAAIVKFGKDSIGAYGESEEAQKRLAFAFQKFPALASTSQAELQKLNSELQRKTKFDDDNIASGQAVLAQFKLTGEQLKATTPLLLDYASATGKDVPAAAQDVGKALLGNAKALKNVGIAYKSTGDPAKDFANITQLLREKVGGFADNEAKTAAGRTAILKNQFGELEETAGSKLLPALSKLTSIGLTVVTWMQDNTGKAKALAIGVGALVAVLAVAKAITLATSAAQTVMAATSAIVRGATLAWTAAQWVLNAALTANPIGIVIVAIAALVAGIIIAYKNSETFRNIVQAAFRGIAITANWLWNSVLRPVISFILEGFAKITAGIAAFLRGLSHIPGFGWAKDAADKMQNAADKAHALAAGIRNIPNSKNVSINVTPHVMAGRIKVGGQMVNVGMFASGGVNIPAGWKMVGEQGPELMWTPGGDTVINARDTARLMSGRGGTAPLGGSEPIVIENKMVVDGRVLASSLAKFERDRGVSLRPA